MRRAECQEGPLLQTMRKTHDIQPVPCFDDAVVQRYTASAWNYYLINGDPDTPEAKAEQARRQREYRAMMPRSNRRYGGMFDSYDDPDDFPEPPLEPDYIPYY